MNENSAQSTESKKLKFAFPVVTVVFVLFVICIFGFPYIRSLKKKLVFSNNLLNQQNLPGRASESSQSTNNNLALSPTAGCSELILNKDVLEFGKILEIDTKMRVVKLLLKSKKEVYFSFQDPEVKAYFMPQNCLIIPQADVLNLSPNTEVAIAKFYPPVDSTFTYKENTLRKVPIVTGSKIFLYVY